MVLHRDLVSSRPWVIGVLTRCSAGGDDGDGSQGSRARGGLSAAGYSAPEDDISGECSALHEQRVHGRICRSVERQRSSIYTQACSGLPCFLLACVKPPPEKQCHRQEQGPHQGSGICMLLNHWPEPSRTQIRRKGTSLNFVIGVLRCKATGLVACCLVKMQARRCHVHLVSMSRMP